MRETSVFGEKTLLPKMTGASARPPVSLNCENGAVCAEEARAGDGDLRVVAIGELEDLGQAEDHGAGDLGLGAA